MFIDKGNFYANIATFQNAVGQNRSVFLPLGEFGDFQQFCRPLICDLGLNSHLII